MPAFTIASLIVFAIKLVVSIVVSQLVGLAIRSFMGKPKRATANPRQLFGANGGAGSADTNPLQSGLSAGGPKREVIGQIGVRASSLIANKKVDETHHWVAVVSDQPVTEFVKVYVRSVEVTLDANGVVTSGPWAKDGKETIKFTFYDGTQTEPLQELIDLDLVEEGSIGLETAIVHAEITVPQTDEFVQLFGGAVPDFIFELKGSRMYDPTDKDQSAEDRSTWKWANEAILVQAYHQVSRLGRDRPVSEIDWDDVASKVSRHRSSITSKRGDTAPRFAFNGLWSTVRERHQDIEQRIGEVHGGGLIDFAIEPRADGVGSLQRFYTSDPDGAPVVVIGEDDIGPSGGSGPEDASEIDERPNAVRVTFFNRSWTWERYTLILEFPDDVAEDGGITEFLDLDLDGCDSHAQAATLGLLAYNRARHGQTWQGQWSPRLLPVQANDVVSLVVPQWELSEEDRLRVVGTGVDPDDYPTLVIGRDNPDWHDDAGLREPVEIDLILDPDQDGASVPLPAPTVTVTSGGTAVIEVNGVQLPGVRVTVTGPPDVYDSADIVVSYDEGSDSNDQQQTRRFDGSGSVTSIFAPIPSGKLVTVNVTVRASGQSSTTVAASHTVSGDTVAPSAPTGLAGTGGAAQIDVSADAPGDGDLASLIFAYVASGASAPDMSSVSTRKIRVAAPNEEDVAAAYSGVAAGDYDIYCAASDTAGNISTSAGPLALTVT